MFEPIHYKTAIRPEGTLVHPATTGLGLFFITLAFVCFALSPASRAVTPPPDGGYPNNNTAEGTNALLNLTTGTDNTATGFNALSNNTTGGFNTATGSGALQSNTGFDNTATGVTALQFNTTGYDNTATGVAALKSNTTGAFNTATGFTALYINRTGRSNTATGEEALFGNITGSNNTATGENALSSCFGDDCGPGGDNNTATGVSALAENAFGNNNTATGVGALTYTITGSNNTAEGFQALKNSTGSNNIALGSSAGINLTTGNNNIDIGALGLAGDSDTIRIGRVGVQKAAYMQGISGTTVGSGATVIVGSNGRLGTVQSSVRFKDEIKPMDKASEAILALKPVTFRYKKELDPEGIPQFGLVAEQVEKVNPDLVARDEKGHVYTVRYEAVNAMLLNEFLKEHQKVEEQGCKLQEQESTISQLKNTMAQQQKKMEALAANLKEQAAEIQKVSAQLELSKPALRTVAGNQ